MAMTTDRTRLDRRLLIQSSAALGASPLWPLPAMAQAEPVKPPYLYDCFTDDVTDLCARYYGTTKGAVLSSLRETREVKARQSAMYIARRLSGRSLPDLGRRFGGRDHTTVLHAVRKIETLIASNPACRRDIECLTNAAHRIARIRIAALQSMELLS